MPGAVSWKHGPAIAAETARRLSCDASLIAIIESERGEPLNVGRKTRTIPPAIRRALELPGRGCRFPGCSFKRYVDGHHVKHWAHGGETKLSNLMTLCRFHHRLVHEGRVVIQVLDDGAFRFVRPDGQAFDSPAPRSTEWAAPVRITPSTAVTRWRGEALDQVGVIDWLMRNREQTKNVPAGTSQDR